MKDLIGDIVSELSEDSGELKESVIDLKVLMEEYFQSGDQGYLDSAKRCLKKLKI